MTRMSTDELGSRMKAYEAVEAQRRLDVTLPICARIDGRRFSKFTRGFDRPFDPHMSAAMRATCAHLVEHTRALIGYVQSDEISLVWQAVGEGSSIFFDGRVQKMTSVLAAMATAHFALRLSRVSATHAAIVEARAPVFDARVWQVPSRIEAANTLLWRAMDARKNSVSAVCRAHYSAKAMHGQGQADMREMLALKGVDFEADFSSADKWGVFYQRRVREVELTEPEWFAIPEKHRPVSRIVVRSFVEPLDIGYFGDVSDRAAVIFGDLGGAD